MAEFLQTAGPVLGTIAIIAIIFAESGLLIGFFLPGDSLLFTAGVLASQGIFSLPILIVGCFLAAVLGDSVGYLFGRRVGRRLFQREDSIFFHKKNLVRAQEFYEKHGAKTIVLARFVPVVRTFAPIVAGMGEMHYNRFVSYNVFGGLLWAVGVLIAGNLLGSQIPADQIDHYLLPIIVIIVLISVAPAAYHILKEPEARAGLLNMAKKPFNRPTVVPRDELP